MKNNQLVIVCSVDICDFSVNSVLNNSTQRHKGHKVAPRQLNCNNLKFFRALMKFFLFFPILFISVSSFPQQEALKKLLSESNRPDCETMTLNIMNEIADIFISDNYENADSLINILDFFCGKNESIERVIIFSAILNNRLEKKNIETYLTKNYANVYEYRKIDAKSADYSTHYEENIEYYGYLPLRHPIDSIIMMKSKELLDKDLVSNDDKLFCILFAYGQREFKRSLSNNEFKNSHSRATINEKRYQNSRKAPSLIIFSGVHTMLGNKNRVFGNNHYVGFSIPTPLKNNIIADFGMNIRFNANDKEFLFYAMEDTNRVNSKTTLLFYITVGYKVLDKKNIILIPQIGVGFESTLTGLNELIENDLEEDFYKYYDLNALNLSAGFTALIPVFVRNYLGLSVKYHYCPYHWNKNLITKFNNNSIGCEVLFRF